MATKRSYKAAWGFEEALDYLEKQQDEQFEPELVKKFIANAEEVGINTLDRTGGY